MFGRLFKKKTKAEGAGTAAATRAEDAGAATVTRAGGGGTPSGAMSGLIESKNEEGAAEDDGTVAARKIPAGVQHLSEDGTLEFEGSMGANDFDAAELERLVGEYGPAIKAVDLL